MPLPFFGRKVHPETRQAVLDYYQAATLVTAYQDNESGKYNAILANHVPTMYLGESLQAILAAAEALCEADREATRRQNALTVPDIAGQDWAAWNALYLKHLEWVEASRAAFEAFQRSGELPTARVESLFVAAETQRSIAERASRDLLRAVGAKANDVVSIMRNAQSAFSADRG